MRERDLGEELQLLTNGIQEMGFQAERIVAEVYKTGPHYVRVGWPSTEECHPFDREALADYASGKVERCGTDAQVMVSTNACSFICVLYGAFGAGNRRTISVDELRAPARPGGELAGMAEHILSAGFKRA